MKTAKKSIKRTVSSVMLSKVKDLVEFSGWGDMCPHHTQEDFTVQ